MSSIGGNSAASVEKQKINNTMNSTCITDFPKASQTFQDIRSCERLNFPGPNQGRLHGGGGGFGSSLTVCFHLGSDLRGGIKSPHEDFKKITLIDFRQNYKLILRRLVSNEPVTEIRVSDFHPKTGFI